MPIEGAHEPQMAPEGHRPVALVRPQQPVAAVAAGQYEEQHAQPADVQVLSEESVAVAGRQKLHFVATITVGPLWLLLLLLLPERSLADLIGWLARVAV